MHKLSLLSVNICHEAPVQTLFYCLTVERYGCADILQLTIDILNILIIFRFDTFHSIVPGHNVGN